MELIIAGAIGLAGWGAAALAWGAAVKLFKKAPRVSSPLVDQWVEMVERQIKKLPFLSAQGKQAALFMLIFSPPAFLFGLYLFHNVVLAVLCVLLVFLAFEQKAAHRRQLYIEEVNTQLAGAIRVFSAEFASTPQVERAVGAVARRIPDPLGSIFARAHRAFLANTDPDRVFGRLAADLPSAHGRMFVQLMRLAKKGTAVGPLFNELASRVTVARELSIRARSETTGERLMSLVVTAAPLPLYLVLRAVMPEVNDFLNGTFAGRLVVFVSFASAVVFALIDWLVGRGVDW